MQEIIFRQRDAARPLMGRTFVMSIAGIVLKLAVAQIVVNLLISMTDMSLLSVAFYLYAAWLLIDFVRGAVAGCVYTLREDTLVLERKLGDSTITMIEVPLDRVVSLREIHMAENLHISYRNVMHIDGSSRPALRVRAAFLLSLLSSHLARAMAGKRAQDVIGHVIVYDEGSLRRACTFCPGGELLKRLEQPLGEKIGFDERMTRAKKHTLYARALEHAFPALYPFVDPLVKAEDVAWAREEIARQKAERQEKKSPAKKNEPKEETKGETKEEPRQETAGAQPETPRRRRKQG